MFTASVQQSSPTERVSQNGRAEGLLFKSGGLPGTTNLTEKPLKAKREIMYFR